MATDIPGMPSLIRVPVKLERLMYSDDFIAQRGESLTNCVEGDEDVIELSVQCTASGRR